MCVACPYPHIRARFVQLGELLAHEAHARVELVALRLQSLEIAGLVVDLYLQLLNFADIVAAKTRIVMV